MKLLWIPFIAFFVGMIGMPSGNYAWEELPLLARYSLVGVGVFFVGAMGSMLVSSILVGVQNRALHTRGRPAQATILQLWDTGTTINKDPLVRLQLEVHPEGEPIFEAETELLVSRLHIPQFQPGAVVPVKYDPQSRQVAIAPEV